MLVSAVPVATTEPAIMRRRELAAFLKARRAALSPEDFGLPRTARRRAKGLLREEIAQRAGVSVTWYTWLEQAREIQASPDLVERLGAALRLSEAEHRHLRLLADPRRQRLALTDTAPMGLVAWIRGLDPQPAYALNGLWDIIAWNDAASDLLGNFPAMLGPARNLLRLLFMNSGWRELFVDWEEIAAASVAQFRAAAAQAPEDRAYPLIETLRQDSDAFARLWDEGAVVAPEIRIKRMRHPQLGLISLAFASMRPDGAGEDVSVTIYARPSQD